MSDVTRTTCVIAGGGPAGAMLGWLLARAGIPVLVLEKHPDFLRDFRGDTIHSSTIQIMDDLGVVDDFLARPHQRQTGNRAITDDGEMLLADYGVLKIKYPFIAYMPQWDFLDYVVGQASRYDTFTIRMNATVTGLIEEDGRVAGLRYRHEGAEHEVRALLTVAADGRHSRVREAAGLSVRTLGAPMDLLWFRISREADDPAYSFARLTRGQMLAMIARDTYWQAAYVVPKDANGRPESDIGQLRDRLEDLLPWLHGRTAELRGPEDVHRLDVQLNRAVRWHRPGLLAIGDAAHAMSVVGGVGINLAVQDAVATANLLAAKLARGRLRDRDLAAVQRRRMPATVLTQRLQATIQNRFLVPLLAGRTGGQPPRILRKLFKLGPFERAKARLIAVGFRPERADRLPVGAAPAADPGRAIRG
ncbi:monooxygenase [Actinoplanes sp. NBRC 14428]|uniref:2-polyprenyl-6-methoxyphenol hydroxylase-like FAD-dependent oxidoreductase n=1 Tax=Pseudosporangium ferrugineum TaxID=439699 RepID=A0A2T0RX77_9ACTN|nr:FAD-dependent oxidoreductase [Pseudosporangium ferrugineum]PRY25796.1 2-polyprenyl-6-methoxyphenol hydroxylase-like FAD-dependent oxidoreductase [Pseudosporangium ferrugineum]BCJ56154.1 monooxygenase [Actinoplanes sp. NBRC 14428]